MTSTDDLITSLAADTRPLDRHAAARRLVLALGGGCTLSILLIAIVIGDPLLGIRDVDVMTVGVKLGFTVALLLLATKLLYRTGRPGDDARPALVWLSAPVLLLALLSAVALARASADVRPQLIFGSTWAECVVSITLLALPVFGLIIWAFRSLAPTDLRFAGMVGGLAAGGVAAFAYALHCPEGSPAFLLVWYGLGIAAAGVIGWAFGPRLLRW